MTTPADLSTYRCPACGYAATGSSSRTCPACQYHGDWIQPGETATYAARRMELARAADAAYGECVRLHLAAARASAASEAADRAYQDFTGCPGPSKVTP
jgi:hypothetical protein